MKKEENPSFFKELGCFMRPYKFKYGLSILISILAVAANLLAFLFVGFMAGSLFRSDPSFSKVALYLLLAISAKLISGIFLNTSTWISHKAAYFTLEDIRYALADKMLRLPLGYFEVKGNGRLKTLMVDHVEGMEKTLAHMLPELTANLLVPLVSVIWLFFVDWRLALILFAWVILGFSVTGGMMKNYDERFKGQISCLKNMNQASLEYVNGIEVIKNFGRDEDVYDKYEKSIYKHANYNIGWMKETLIYSSLGMAVAPFTLFPILLFGILFFIEGSLSASSLIMALLLTFGIFQPLMQAMNYFDSLAGMGVNAKEIKDVLDYEELKRGSLASLDKASVTLKDVSFGYAKDKLVLKDINLSIEEGKTLALVGVSGSGKSTIGKLIGGYWDTNRGEVLIGNANINSYSQDYLNSIIAYVDQETFLFDLSIMDNIRLGNSKATDAEIIAASKKCGCDDFIKALPNGYYTMAGEAGNFLSGGEKQRIAILRAMIKNAKIMILDEATSSTDPENEESIQRALLEASRNKTLIVIAHRLYTVMKADKIAVINEGRVEATGTHEELLEKSPTYQSLWEASEVNDYA